MMLKTGRWMTDILLFYKLIALALRDVPDFPCICQTNCDILYVVLIYFLIHTDKEPLVFRTSEIPTP